MAKLTGRPVGRPSVYTEEIAAEICDRMAAGESLRSICRSEHMPDKTTVLLWISDDREGFSSRYHKAFSSRIANHVDELLDIADDGSNDFMERQDGTYAVNGEAIQRSRLRVDTRKWIMSKLMPQYADKPEEKLVVPKVIEIIRATKPDETSSD